MPTPNHETPKPLVFESIVNQCKISYYFRILMGDGILKLGKRMEVVIFPPEKALSLTLISLMRM